LREVIAQGMGEHYGASQKIQNILITNGSQQALSMVCQVLLDPGDRVLTTSPTYLGALMTFRSLQAEVDAVPMDDDGIMVDHLEEKLENLASRNMLPKLVYLIPTFQNPTGITIPLKRRKEIYRLICKYDLLSDNIDVT